MELCKAHASKVASMYMPAFARGVVQVFGASCFQVIRAYHFSMIRNMALPLSNFRMCEAASRVVAEG